MKFISWWSAFDDFLVSHWMWGMTFDIGHLFISAGVTFLLFQFFTQETLFKSMILSIGSHAFSLLTYTGVIMLLLRFSVPGEYDAVLSPQELGVIQVMHACLWLAVIHAILQACFFLLITQLRNRSFGYTMLPWISNGIAAGLSYFAIRIMGQYLL